MQNGWKTLVNFDAYNVNENSSLQIFWMFIIEYLLKSVFGNTSNQSSFADKLQMDTYWLIIEMDQSQFLKEFIMDKDNSNAFHILYMLLAFLSCFGFSAFVFTSQQCNEPI